MFIIADKVFSCSTGDAVFINNQEFHALQDASPSNSDWKFVNFSPTALLGDWLTEHEPALDVKRLSGSEFSNVVREREHPDIVFLAGKLMEEMERQEPGFHSLVRSIVWSLMVLLSRLAPPLSRETPKEPDKFHRVYPALRHISTHYADAIEVPELAKRCHCSLSTFRRIFKDNLGCLPLKYVNNYRLKVAATKLASSQDSILRVAFDSGFPTLSNFNRQFKATYNQSPREYRRENQIKNGERGPRFKSTSPSRGRPRE